MKIHDDDDDCDAFKPYETRQEGKPRHGMAMSDFAKESNLHETGHFDLEQL